MACTLSRCRIVAVQYDMSNCDPLYDSMKGMVRGGCMRTDDVSSMDAGCAHVLVHSMSSVHRVVVLDEG